MQVLKPQERVALSVAQFCERYGVSKTMAYDLLKRGKIERVKLGVATRVTVESADRWFNSLRKAP